MDDASEVMRTLGTMETTGVVTESQLRHRLNHLADEYLFAEEQIAEFEIQQHEVNKRLAAWRTFHDGIRGMITELNLVMKGEYARGDSAEPVEMSPALRTLFERATTVQREGA